MSTQKLLELVRELEPVMGAEQVDALLHVAAPEAVEKVPGLCPHSPAQVKEGVAEVDFDLSRAICAQFTHFGC
ncbi:MAG: hypothetical protein HYY01_13630 [Chloroflexi bacterium]|nr:hypothetical protein [Chloroflexota bacterium]